MGGRKRLIEKHEEWDRGRIPIHAMVLQIHVDRNDKSKYTLNKYLVEIRELACYSIASDSKWYPEWFNTQHMNTQTYQTKFYDDL